MSILFDICKDIFRVRKVSEAKAECADVKKVLNVGGNNKAIEIPGYYATWRHDLLDIDPSVNPDVLCDARKLISLPGGIYDAIYCSHNLEHYYRHDASLVVRGFFHMLKDDGFAEVCVPDIEQVIGALVDLQLGLDDVLYVSPSGPITAHDVIYGFQAQIVRSGQEFYAHKMGFTPASLSEILLGGGFSKVYLRKDDSIDYLSVHALAFKKEPNVEQKKLLGGAWVL